MGIKKYILATIVLIVATMVFVFTIEPGDYRIELFEKTFLYPNAVWVVLPTFVLFITTLLHMFYFGVKHAFSSKSISKDNENLLILLQRKMLKEDIEIDFTNKDATQLASIISQLDIGVSSSHFNCSDEKTNKIYDFLAKTKAGEHVNAKSFKLSDNNTLVNKNALNKISKDDNYAVSVVKNLANYSQENVKTAFLSQISKIKISAIKKAIEDGLSVDVQILNAIIQKNSRESDENQISNDEIIILIVQANAKNEDLIQISRDYKELSLPPEKIIKLYGNLLATNEQFTKSYLYVLAEYQMMNEIREILASSQKDEFLMFKAYVDLRDSGKHYPLSIFSN